MWPGINLTENIATRHPERFAASGPFEAIDPARSRCNLGGMSTCNSKTLFSRGKHNIHQELQLTQMGAVKYEYRNFPVLRGQNQEHGFAEHEMMLLITVKI